MTSGVEGQSTLSAIKAEYKRMLTIRRDDLVAVAVNAGLVTICWFLLPDTALNWLFALHGALAFAYVLEMWMLADAPATNVLGRDPDRALSLLHDPAAMRQTLLIWTLVAQPQPLRQVGPAGLWLGTAVACAVSLIVFALGPVITSKIARRRLDRLSGYLSNPEHG